MLSAESRSRTKEAKFGAGACASVAGEFGACSVQEYENLLCFGEIGTVAAYDRLALAENAMVVTKKETNRNRVRNELKKGGDDKLGELYFKTARDF